MAEKCDALKDHILNTPNIKSLKVIIQMAASESQLSEYTEARGWQQHRIWSSFFLLQCCCWVREYISHIEDLQPQRLAGPARQPRKSPMGISYWRSCMQLQWLSNLPKQFDGDLAEPLQS